MLRCSVVVIGDEILGGYVQDTNSGWIAGRLQAAGVPLDRIVTVPDDVAAIREALGVELGRSRPRVVLTSGGIGSTPDDVTLEGVAAALGRPLVEEPSIVERIDRAIAWTAEQGLEATPAHVRAMRRMALVPDGAALVHGAGFLPGIACDVDGGLDAGGAVVVVLPGVPSELRRIVEHGVEPSLLAGRGRPQHVVEVQHPYPESTLNPALEGLVAAFPAVAVGSYPGEVCTIRLKGAREDVEAAAAQLAAALEALAAQPGAQRLAATWRERWRTTTGRAST